MHFFPGRLWSVILDRSATLRIRILSRKLLLYISLRRVQWAACSARARLHQSVPALRLSLRLSCLAHFFELRNVYRG